MKEYRCTRDLTTDGESWFKEGDYYMCELGEVKAKVLVHPHAQDAFYQTVPAEEFEEHFELAYPEHCKLNEVKRQSQEIRTFLRWLRGEESGWVIAEGRSDHLMWDGAEELFRADADDEEILHEYLGIDEGKLGEEQDQMHQRYKEKAH